MGGYFGKGTCSPRCRMAFFVDFVFSNQTTQWIGWRPQLFSQTFLLLSFSKAPSNASADDRNRECWPDMESIRIKSIEIRLRSGVDLLTLEQLSNYEFNCAQDKSDSSCRNALRPERGAKPFCKLILHLRSWENKRFVRILVPSTENCRKCMRQKFTCSQILFHVWENKRWTSQKSSSPEDGMIISSDTGNPQGELMENRFNSDSTYHKSFLVPKRTR